MRCFAWFNGPIRTEKPNITSKLPKLNAKANFAGLMAMKGRVMKATKKQTAAPNKLAPNPSSLSQRDSANHASSSLERASDLRGI